MPEATKILPATRAQVRYDLWFLSHEKLRILGAFLLIVLPLAGFAALVEELREDGGFFFDPPLLLALHQLASPGIDSFFVVVSKLGYQYGVIPLDICIAAWLLYKRHYRDGLFFALAVGGSALLNLAAKGHFTRLRPDLWVSITPELTYSFPSGHAMGSATLATAVVLLSWQTRWRWWAVSAGVLFVLLVGMSRVYLGVHFPSDILAGWSAATAWVLAMYWLVASRAPPPPVTSGARPAHDNISDSKVAHKADARR